MTDIVWPADLPQVLILDGLAAQQEKNVIRTQMDAGPDKVRRRYTVTTKNFDGVLIVKEAGREILEDFFNNTLGSGALRFLMKDPQTLITSEFRFREVYREESIDGNWKIILPLEKMNA